MLSRLIFDLDSEKQKETAWCWFAGLNATTGEPITAAAAVGHNVAVRSFVHACYTLARRRDNVVAGGVGVRVQRSRPTDLASYVL